MLLVDALRPPGEQLTGRVYVSAVHQYQRFCSPVISRISVCRFKPSCSEYSAAAVDKYGIGRGLMITVWRLVRCNPRTPMGTVDSP